MRNVQFSSSFVSCVVHEIFILVWYAIHYDIIYVIYNIYIHYIYITDKFKISFHFQLKIQKSAIRGWKACITWSERTFFVQHLCNGEIFRTFFKIVFLSDFINSRLSQWLYARAEQNVFPLFRWLKMEWDSLIPANQNGYDIVKYVFIVWCLIDLCIPGVDPGFYKSRKARRHKKSLVGSGVCSLGTFWLLSCL